MLAIYIEISNLKISWLVKERKQGLSISLILDLLNDTSIQTRDFILHKLQTKVFSARQDTCLKMLIKEMNNVELTTCLRLETFWFSSLGREHCLGTWNSCQISTVTKKIHWFIKRLCSMKRIAKLGISVTLRKRLALHTKPLLMACLHNSLSILNIVSGYHSRNGPTMNT